MSGPWFDIVGVGDSGAASLSPLSREVVEGAEIVIASARLHDLMPSLAAERIVWPSPFDALIRRIRDLKGRRLVVLATGDPLWFSVGARIAREIDPAEIRFHPQLSAFQLAAARLGWSLDGVETLTAHGRPPERILPFVAPGRRLLVLTGGAEAPARIADMLTRRGYGESRLSVLAHLGGAAESRIDGVAETWSGEVPAFHVLSIDCVAGPDAIPQPRVPGLSDDAFAHDGKMTKREVRAATLARLMPLSGALLWDIGAGAGSVAIEWLRAAHDSRAIGIEPRADRREMCRANALALGVPHLALIDGTAPAALADLPSPDAVFIGGGLSPEVAEAALDALGDHGRLVANAVTLESEAVLIGLQERLGGELTRIRVEHARPVGPFRGWQAAMPVTQWSLLKR